MSWQEHLRTQGFAHFPGLTPEPLVKAARDAIEADLSSNYDSARQSEYDSRSFCPDLKGTPPIMNLLEQSPVHQLLDEIFEVEKIGWDGGQIEPVQLMCDVGDVVVAHYQLGHSAAVNTADVDRIAIYFRVWLKSMESNRWHYLTNVWDGWKC